MVLLSVLGLFMVLNVEIMESIQNRWNVSYKASSTTIKSSAGSADNFASNLPLTDNSRLEQPPRPQHLRLVFLGDSITRYQYLSLAYFLTKGAWYTHEMDRRQPNASQEPHANYNLMQAHSLHDPKQPLEDWNRFFEYSNRILWPHEICDCERKADHSVAVERRYFWDKELDNKLVYINLNGHEGTGSRSGIYGRLDPTLVFEKFDELVELHPRVTSQQRADTELLRPFERSSESREIPYQDSRYQLPSNRSVALQDWEVLSWGDVVRQHLSPMRLGDRGNVPVLLNAGLHRHEFPGATQELIVALNETKMFGIWKTTSYGQDELRNDSATLRPTDEAMCSLLSQCLDLSWTSHIHPSLFSDRLHFLEPVYRLLNEELLHMLNALPSGYTMLDRNIILF